MPELRDFQRRTVAFVREHRRSIVASEPGTGKTAPCIVAADLPALVLAPASLILNWRREVEMFRPAARAHFDVVSYADPRLDRLDPGDYGTVIADEAHYLKTPEARRTKVGCRLLAQAERAIAVTGTLVPNRPIELWPLLYSLRVTDLRFDRFAHRYANAYEDPVRGLVATGASNLPELRRLLAPHVIRFTKAQVMPELPPKEWRVVALDLPAPSNEKAFSLADLKRMPVEIAFEAMSDVLREHGRRKLAPAIQHCRDLLDGGVEKLVVMAHHREVVRGLADGLAEYGAVVVMGGQSRGARQAAVDAFQEGAPRVFSGQLTAAGVGITLTASNYVVLVEASWVPAVLDQAADRCHRIGTEGAVTVDLLTIDRSIDEAMLRRALEKLQVIERVVPVTPYARGDFETRKNPLLN